MQIQSVNNFSNIKHNQNPQFRSVYPVVHWVAEKNCSYAPELTKETAKHLNGKIIRMLNTSSQEIEQRLQALYDQIKTNGKSSAKIDQEIASLNLIKRVKSFIARCDESYSKKSFARGFYEGNEGFSGDKYDAVAHIMTGDEAVYFEQNFGKPLGKLKAMKENSVELEKAKEKYWRGGQNFVRAEAEKFIMPNKIPAELHVKFERIRSKTGKPKGYNLVSMKFFPKYGPENPFMLTEWAKR